MVYINKDGAVVERNPFNIFGWFWGAINFIYLLLLVFYERPAQPHRKQAMEQQKMERAFQTLISPSYSKHGDKYVQDFRPPGSGPPKPPSKKFGGFGPSSSGPSPPPMGGGGCGCG